MHGIHIYWKIYDSMIISFIEYAHERKLRCNIYLIDPKLSFKHTK